MLIGMALAGVALTWHALAACDPHLLPSARNNGGHKAYLGRESAAQAVLAEIQRRHGSQLAKLSGDRAGVVSLVIRDLHRGGRRESCR